MAAFQTDEPRPAQPQSSEALRSTPETILGHTFSWRAAKKQGVGLHLTLGLACFAAAFAGLRMATWEDSAWTVPRVSIGALLVTVPMLLGGLITARAMTQARTAVLEAANASLAREVEERRLAEESLRRAKEQAEAVNRELAASNARLAEAHQAAQAAEVANQAKSHFLATTSHEIRTPLSGVLGFAQMLADSPLSSEQRDWVDTIRGAGQTLLMLINDVLDFSKIEAGRLTLESIPFNPVEASREVVAVLSAEAHRKKIDLRFSVDASIPELLLGDVVRFKQVLFNLLGNAVKFTLRGSVDVSLEWTKAEAVSGSLRVKVRDSGIGISPEQQANLFKGFRQADSSVARRFGGTGLGLSIVKSLVEIQFGEIGLTSEVDRGSTFWFVIPYSVAPAPAAGADRRVVALLPTQTEVSKRLRVLLAEDMAVNQKLAISLLQRQGCDVELAQNGREAVEMSGRARFDIVFMDCQMPELDGFDAAREIRRLEAATGYARGYTRPGRLPIVAMTANALQGDREACLEAGMDDYISKPYRPDDLARVLNRWTRAGLRPELPPASPPASRAAAA